MLVCWFKTVQFKKLSQKKEALAGFEPTDVGTVASALPSELVGNLFGSVGSTTYT